MPDEERLAFLCGLQSDPALRQELYDESSFEAAFYSRQWLERDSITEDLTRTFFAAGPVAPSGKEQQNRQDAPDELMLSSDAWQRMVDRAFSDAHKKVRPLFLMSYLYTNLKVVSAAVCILLVASAALFYALKKPADMRYVQEKRGMVGTSGRSETVITSPEGDTGVIPEQAAVSAYDTIKEIRIAGKAPHKFLLPSTGKSVFYLSEGSGFFAEHTTDIAVMIHTDTIVSISMKQGSAVFHVKKAAYKRFSVITPHFEARVTGTVFEVAVSSQKSAITVLEGEVVVTTMQGTQEVVTSSRGVTACTSQDSLIKDILQNSSMLKQRNTLLKSYLQYMHKSNPEHLPVDDVYDTLALKERQILDSLCSLSDDMINARLMHYKAAHNSEKERRYEKAGNHFLQIFTEDPDDVVARLALMRLCILSTHDISIGTSRSWCEKYLETYSGGFGRQEGMVLYIREALAQHDFQRALPYMLRFVDQFPASSFADDIAFNAAQIARLELLDISKALSCYEFVAGNFPGSQYAEDALYWAGWCVVQQQTNKNDNTFIRQYRENYPDGTWHSAISEK